MKLSYLSIIVVMIFMIGVAFAGCTSSSPSAPAATTPAGSTGSQAPQAPAAATTVASSSGGISGAGLFGGLNYNWVEYKMAASGMTIYMRFDKSGACSMRFDNPPQGMPATMDCSSTGGKAQSNPNQLASDAQVSCSGTEQVTVPAGSFSATKCTVTSKSGTATVWIVPGKYMAKMESTSSAGTVDMVLNAYG